MKIIKLVVLLILSGPISAGIINRLIKGKILTRLQYPQTPISFEFWNKLSNPIYFIVTNGSPDTSGKKIIRLNPDELYQAKNTEININQPTFIRLYNSAKSVDNSGNAINPINSWEINQPGRTVYVRIKKEGKKLILVHKQVLLFLVEERPIRDWA